MNSNTLKITGIVELPEPLEKRHDYTFAGRLTVRSIESLDNEDGTDTDLHKAQLTHIAIVNKLGATVKGVKKGSKSQVLRFKIMEHGDDEFYQKAMGKIIDNLEDILNKYV